MERQSLRLGFVGAGFQARNLAAAAACLDGVSVVGFHSRTVEAAIDTAHRFDAEPWAGPEELRAAGLDVVMIASMSSLHGPQIRQFSEAARFVFVEKPAVTRMMDLPTAESLAEGGRLIVGHPLRTAPGIHRLFDRLRNGAIGPLRELRSRRAQLLAPSTGWKADPSASGGLSLHEIHELDLLCLAGGPISESRRYTVKDAGDQAVGVHTALLFDSGAVASHQIGSRSHRSEWMVELIGDSGTLLADFLGAEVRLFRPGRTAERWPILGTEAANASLRSAGDQRGHNAGHAEPSAWMADLARGAVSAVVTIAHGGHSILLDSPLRATRVALELEASELVT